MKLLYKHERNIKGKFLDTWGKMPCHGTDTTRFSPSCYLTDEVMQRIEEISRVFIYIARSKKLFDLTGLKQWTFKVFRKNKIRKFQAQSPMQFQFGWPVNPVWVAGSFSSWYCFWMVTLEMALVLRKWLMLLGLFSKH